MHLLGAMGARIGHSWLAQEEGSGALTRELLLPGEEMDSSCMVGSRDSDFGFGVVLSLSLTQRAGNLLSLAFLCLAKQEGSSHPPLTHFKVEPSIPYIYIYIYV